MWKISSPNKTADPKTHSPQTVWPGHVQPYHRDGTPGSHVEAVCLLPLSGTSKTFTPVAEAMTFIENHDPTIAPTRFVRHELIVRHSNGDEVQGRFQRKQETLRFLERCVHPGGLHRVGETP